MDNKIAAVRRMTDKEMENVCWDVDNLHSNPMVVVLSDGSIIVPSRDEEMNGPGHLLHIENDKIFSLMEG